MAPTEMSKLPEMMRMVAPAATSPSTDVCSRMLNRLRGLKKRSFTRPVIRASTSVRASSSTHWFAATNLQDCVATGPRLPLTHPGRRRRLHLLSFRHRGTPS